MKKTAVVLFLSFLFSLELQASPVHTIQSFKEINPILEKIPGPKSKIWLVFDIDNTILTPDLKDPKSVKEATDGYYYKRKQILFAALSKKYKEEAAKEHAYLQAVSEWNEVVKKDPPMSLVDKDFQKWLNDKHDYPSMAHTARELSLQAITEKQLSKFKINFSSPIKNKVTFDKNSDHAEDALFENGIYFVGRGGIKAKNHKGKRFVQLLREIKKHKNEGPSHVVFVDDRYEHVAGMVQELELELAGIPCSGFHITTISAVAE